MSLLVVTVLLVEYVVVPQLLSARQDLTLLASGAPWALATALALEAASLLSYSALSRAALDPQGRPSYWTILRVDLTGLGVSHVVPGGGAAAVGLRLRLMSGVGVRPRSAATSLAIQTVASIVMLVGLFVVGLAMAVPRLSGHPDFEIAGAAALVLLAGSAVLLTSLVRTTDRTLEILGSGVRRTPVLSSPAVRRILDDAAVHIRALAADQPLLRRAGLFGFGNWFLDAACLWLCLGAYGYWAPVGPLLAVYAAASLVALLPLTPGGLGIVEGLLVPLLTYASLRLSRLHLHPGEHLRP